MIGLAHAERVSRALAIDEPRLQQIRPSDNDSITFQLETTINRILVAFVKNHAGFRFSVFTQPPSPTEEQNDVDMSGRA